MRPKLRYIGGMSNHHIWAACVVGAWMTVAGCQAPPAAEPKREGPDPRVRELEEEIVEVRAALEKEIAGSDLMRKSETELKAKADEADALQKKLTEVVGKFGDVTTEDGSVRVELVDKILFPVGEADLTDNGREVLAEVGKALKDIEDKQIWVQGHTDSSPIVVRKPKAEKSEKGKKGKKGEKSEKAEAPAEKPAEAEASNDAVLPFVTNWELSAARALTVVHYLQDEAKIDPSRLAAVAFGQYRPSSKSKSKNRRIEIVLYPRAKISPK